jgi:hypothetical protein
MLRFNRWGFGFCSAGPSLEQQRYGKEVSKGSGRERRTTGGPRPCGSLLLSLSSTSVLPPPFFEINNAYIKQTSRLIKNLAVP